MSDKAQTIFRVEKSADNPFVMIDRRVIENPKLSWKAKGLLAYLLSRPDDWTVRFKDLVNRAPDGAHTVRAAMKELKAAGHVQVTTERDGGKIIKWTYTVYEVPLADFQQVEKQDVEKRAFKKTKKSLKKGSVKEAAPQPPEILLFKEVVGHHPTKDQRETVIETIQQINQKQGRMIDADYLRPFWKQWTIVSKNSWSIVWLVEWAASGKTNGKQATPRPEPRSFDGIRQFLAEAGNG